MLIFLKAANIIPFVSLLGVFPDITTKEIFTAKLRRVSTNQGGIHPIF
jgi:hypothetical protein